MNLKLFIFSIFIFGCSENIKPVAIDKYNYNYPEQESWNSKIIFSDSGVTRAILYAGHLKKFESSTRTLIDENMKVEFFDLDGSHTSTLTSKMGWADETSKDLFAEGDVKIISVKNVIIETPEMNWNNKTQKVHSQKFVKITSPTEKLQGIGFESDHNLRNYKIFKVSGSTFTE